MRHSSLLAGLLLLAAIVAAEEQPRDTTEKQLEKEQTKTDETDKDDDMSGARLKAILPKVTFSCHNRSGYYADMEFDCEVFHYCNPDGSRFTFLCPSKSQFNQKFMTCDFDKDGMKSCEKAEKYYHLNDKIFARQDESAPPTSEETDDYTNSNLKVELSTKSPPQHKIQYRPNANENKKPFVPLNPTTTLRPHTVPTPHRDQSKNENWKEFNDYARNKDYSDNKNTDDFDDDFDDYEDVEGYEARRSQTNDRSDAERAPSNKEIQNNKKYSVDQIKKSPVVSTQKQNQRKDTVKIRITGLPTNSSYQKPVSKNDKTTVNKSYKQKPSSQSSPISEGFPRHHKDHHLLNTQKAPVDSRSHLEDYGSKLIPTANPQKPPPSPEMAHRDRVIMRPREGAVRIHDYKDSQIQRRPQSPLNPQSQPLNPSFSGYGDQEWWRLMQVPMIVDDRERSSIDQIAKEASFDPRSPLYASSDDHALTSTDYVPRPTKETTNRRYTLKRYPPEDLYLAEFKKIKKESDKKHIEPPRKKSPESKDEARNIKDELVEVRVLVHPEPRYVRMNTQRRQKRQISVYGFDSPFGRPLYNPFSGNSFFDSFARNPFESSFTQPFGSAAIDPYEHSSAEIDDGPEDYERGGGGDIREPNSRDENNSGTVRPGNNSPSSDEVQRTPIQQNRLTTPTPSGPDDEGEDDEQRTPVRGRVQQVTASPQRPLQPYPQQRLPPSYQYHNQGALQRYPPSDNSRFQPGRGRVNEEYSRPYSAPPAINYPNTIPRAVPQGYLQNIRQTPGRPFINPISNQGLNEPRGSGIPFNIAPVRVPNYYHVNNYPSSLHSPGPFPTFPAPTEIPHRNQEDGEEPESNAQNEDDETKENQRGSSEEAEPQKEEDPAQFTSLAPRPDYGSFATPGYDGVYGTPQPNVYPNIPPNRQVNPYNNQPQNSGEQGRFAAIQEDPYAAYAYGNNQDGIPNRQQYTTAAPVPEVSQKPPRRRRPSRRRRPQSQEENDYQSNQRQLPARDPRLPTSPALPEAPRRQLPPPSQQFTQDPYQQQPVSFHSGVEYVDLPVGVDQSLDAFHPPTHSQESPVPSVVYQPESPERTNDASSELSPPLPSVPDNRQPTLPPPSRFAPATNPPERSRPRNTQTQRRRPSAPVPQPTPTSRPRSAVSSEESSEDGPSAPVFGARIRSSSGRAQPPAQTTTRRPPTITVRRPQVVPPTIRPEQPPPPRGNSRRTNRPQDQPQRQQVSEENSEETSSAELPQERRRQFRGRQRGTNQENNAPQGLRVSSSVPRTHSSENFLSNQREPEKFKENPQPIYITNQEQDRNAQRSFRPRGRPVYHPVPLSDIPNQDGPAQYQPKPYSESPGHPLKPPRPRNKPVVTEGGVQVVRPGTSNRYPPRQSSSVNGQNQGRNTAERPAPPPEKKRKLFSPRPRPGLKTQPVISTTPEPEIPKPDVINSNDQPIYPVSQESSSTEASSEEQKSSGSQENPSQDDSPVTSEVQHPETKNNPESFKRVYMSKNGASVQNRPVWLQHKKRIRGGSTQTQPSAENAKTQDSESDSLQNSESVNLDVIKNDENIPVVIGLSEEKSSS